MLWSMVMCLPIKQSSVGSLKVQFLALSFSSSTLMIFSILLSISRLFSLQTTLMFFFRHKDLATLANIVNQELSHVSSWFNPLSPTCFACNLHKSNFAKISKNNCNAQ